MTEVAVERCASVRLYVLSAVALLRAEEKQAPFPLGKYCPAYVLCGEPATPKKPKAKRLRDSLLVRLPPHGRLRKRLQRPLEGRTRLRVVPTVSFLCFIFLRMHVHAHADSFTYLQTAWQDEVSK